MASTYTPQAAVDYCQAMIHNVPVDKIAAAACDMANSTMWTYYPWRWSVASLTAITCVDGTQDYVPTNTDILRPLRFRLVRTDITPNEFRELDLLANLSPELSRRGGLDTIRAAGWYPAGNFIRLALAPSVGAGQTLQIQGEYQKTPTRMTEPQLSVPFAFPDHFFKTFVEFLLYEFYRLSDDDRAGTVAIQGGMTVYTGQLGIAMKMIEQMARTEDLGQGDEFQWPDQPLGAGRGAWPGLFGN